MRTGSHLNSFFTGDAVRVYRWFSLGANLPGLSIAARSDAHRIVRAAAACATEITITPQAFLTARIAALAPGCNLSLLSLVNALLPKPVEGPAPIHCGAEVRNRELFPARPIGSLNTPAEKAALRWPRQRLAMHSATDEQFSESPSHLLGWRDFGALVRNWPA
jgi:hypothetical protein